MPKLLDFVGKVCTIITVNINFRFQEQAMIDYFTGIVEAIDDNFIWLRHPKIGSKTAIKQTYVVSVSEEQVLDENNPEEAKIIQEYEKRKPEMAANNKIAPQFIDPKKLAELAAQAQKLHGKKQ